MWPVGCGLWAEVEHTFTVRYFGHLEQMFNSPKIWTL